MPRASKAAPKAAPKATKVATKVVTKPVAKGVKTVTGRAMAKPAQGKALKHTSAAVAAGSRARPAVPTNDFLAAQQAALLADRESYMERADLLKAEAQQLAEEMEPGDTQFDEESGEGDSLNVERERDLALSAQARVAVDEIDQALARIASGTYGVCERCGAPIPKARLKALPHAALCVACKSGGLSRR